MSLIHEPRKHDELIDAVLDESFGVALSVLDVVDGNSGVYPQSSQPESVRFLFDLRSGAQRQPQPKFQPCRSSLCRDRFAARRRRNCKDPVRFF